MGQSNNRAAQETMDVRGKYETGAKVGTQAETHTASTLTQGCTRSEQTIDSSETRCWMVWLEHSTRLTTALHKTLWVDASHKELLRDMPSLHLDELMSSNRETLVLVSHPGSRKPLALLPPQCWDAFLGCRYRRLRSAKASFQGQREAFRLGNTGLGSLMTPSSTLVPTHPGPASPTRV